MPLELRDLHEIDETSFDYVVELDVDVPLRTAKPNVPGDPLILRANVYRPKEKGRFPVLVTCGPYGKDIPYQQFHEESFSLVNPEQKSAHSAWEVSDPSYWTSQGYVIVRADERGCGNSPGKLDSLGSNVCDGFFDLIEWSADQPWSSGDIGLLGISYCAASQWPVAACNPRGLKCIIPWEGRTDYYQDRVRHGGILSDKFVQYIYDRQAASTQYGLPGRAARNWGPDSREGDLPREELAANRADQPKDAATHFFRDDEYYRKRDFDWPVVLGYLGAGSQFKYLYFLTGRHDLPFYYDEAVELQRSFLDTCLKDDDREGWLTPGKVPPVNLCVRRGNPGFGDPAAERRMFPRRVENEWPLARTQYTHYHLCPDGSLSLTQALDEAVVTWEAPGGSVRFATKTVEHEVEITGHLMARLSVAVTPRNDSAPSEIDLFVTSRHYDAAEQEISYTGAAGDPVPVFRGWLRGSLRKTIDKSGPLSQIMPKRAYRSADAQKVVVGEVYTVDVEIWPTSVVLLPGETLELQVSSSDSEGVGIFEHDHSEDRPLETLLGYNQLHLGSQYENFLQLPVIPQVS